MRLSNPVLKKVSNASMGEEVARASYGGIAGKTVFLAGVAMLSAILAFVLLNVFDLTYGFYVVASVVCPIVAFVFAMIATFNPASAKITGTLYALFMGFAVGFISCLFDQLYSGVVFAALLATFGTFFIMAVLYATGLIRVGNKFRKFMISALFSLLFLNLIIWIISLFSPVFAEMFYGNSYLSIIISAVMVLFASFMLLLDFDTATRLVESGSAKMYEWTVAFGLTVTLIWLYLEFLQLFAKIADRS